MLDQAGVVEHDDEDVLPPGQAHVQPPAVLEESDAAFGTVDGEEIAQNERTLPTLVGVDGGSLDVSALGVPGLGAVADKDLGQLPPLVLVRGDALLDDGTHLMLHECGIAMGRPGPHVIRYSPEVSEFRHLILLIEDLALGDGRRPESNDVALPLQGVFDPFVALDVLLVAQCHGILGTVFLTMNSDQRLPA